MEISPEKQRRLDGANAAMLARISLERNPMYAAAIACLEGRIPKGCPGPGCALERLTEMAYRLERGKPLKPQRDKSSSRKRRRRKKRKAAKAVPLDFTDWIKDEHEG